MAAQFTPGFRGRHSSRDAGLPPGQYLTDDFPVLSAGPTPRIDLDDWCISLRTETGDISVLTWDDLMGLPQEDVTTDLHCVTRWSKLGTSWRGVSLDVLIDGIDTAAEFVLVDSFGDYTTNLPLEDLLDGQAWVVHEFEGEPLEPEHGGPARLLVPHLYLWKSAKWIRGLTFRVSPELGFWESVGYHEYGDPWREQRYLGD